MKALSVFSGGLDSMLAAQLVRAQGIEVLGLFFETPFFTSSRACRSADTIQLPLKIIDLTIPHLAIVKDPPHGYGGNMNPCIDCHTLMLSKAGRMLEEERADFLITGEVLGQRPMSQNFQSLKIVTSGSGYPDLILRPLSAKRLPETLPEKKGWVRRDLLMDFSGRSRKPQIELAKKLKIEKYPTPAGGCLLTDEGFSRRLKDLFNSDSDFEMRELQLLKIGRHFRIGPETKLVIGRNERENEIILRLSQEKDLVLAPISCPGPTALLIGKSSPQDVQWALSAAASFSDAGENMPIELEVIGKGQTFLSRARSKSEYIAYRI